MGVLVGIDVVGIQRFVFASNRLRDVAGASALVDRATSADGLVGELARQCPSSDGLPDGDPVLMAAGGNAILAFADSENEPDHARSFVASYTRRLIEEMPGLNVAVARRRFLPGQLAAALLALQVDLAAAKAEAMLSVPLLGLGVTASCQMTGQPASTVRSLGQGWWVPVSAAVDAARGRGEQNLHGKWSHLLEGCPAPPGLAGIQFPLELDDLGRSSGERSLMGVVHVDGNGIGQRIKRWLDTCVDDETSDQEVAEGYRRWSCRLSAVAREAMGAAVALVCASIELDGGVASLCGRVEDLNFALKGDNGEALLPLRPILVGGDDVTFVCDGRIALALAVTVARAFQVEVPDLGEAPLSASAGVAIVKNHTPFVRAYALAEKLCTSAKRAARAADPQWAEGAIDWHVGAFRPGQGVEDIRGLDPESRTQSLPTCRPYRLDGSLAEVRSWPWFSTELLGTVPHGLRGKAWAARRSKVKALAALAREGSPAVRQMLQTWQVSEHDLRLPKELDGGFFGGQSPLIDAVELLDRAQVLQ